MRKVCGNERRGRLQMIRRQRSTRSSATIEQQVLAPRGLTWQTFYGGHATFNAQITMMLDQAMQGFNLGVEFKGETFDSGVCNGAAFRDPDGNGLMIHHRYAPYRDGTQP